MTVAAPAASDLLKTAAHGVVLLSEAITECNECFCRIVDCTREELIGKPLLELCPEVQADGAFSAERWQRRWQAARAGLPQWFPWQFRNCDGRRVHALVHLQIGASGAGMIAHVHDLSNLRRSGWITPDTQARLQQVLDHTKAVIFVKDRAGRYVFANRELERVVRMPAEQIVGHTDQELWPPDVAAHFQANDAKVLLNRTAAEFEVTADVGRQRKTFLSFKFPLFGPDDEPYAVCGLATDITDRKRTQDALTRAALAVSSAQGASVLQELVRYLATILEVDAAFIAVPQEVDGPCRMRAQAFFLDGELQEPFEYPLAGTPCEKVIGRAFRIFPSGVQEEFPDDADLGRLGIQSYAGFPLHDGNGAAIGLISAISRGVMQNGEFIESILKIFAVRAAAELERQRAEESLRRSEASYRAIFEASEDAVFIHEWETGRVLDVNRRACEVTGYTYEELKNISIAELCSGDYPYTGEQAAKRVQEAKAGHPIRMEWHRRNKDGSLHWDEIVLRSAVIAGERRILAFTREITERKLAEHALRQAQKMEALGHLTGGIAHDFNNLLTSIMGYVTLAADHAAPARDRKLDQYLEQAQVSCGRARDLIQQMMTFSRGRRGQPRPISLPACVRESVKLFASSLTSSISVESDLDRELPVVMLDPVQLDQILLNLLLNARDAIGGVGTIRVRVDHVRSAADVCSACRQSVTGEFVELVVEDDGPGIPGEIIDRIFEPFFTTKAVGKGSGMGLASVHGIVHELGGHILVKSDLNMGTCFGVLLPAVETIHAGPEVLRGHRSRTAQPALHGRVLVVDDERAVAAFMRDLLESWGLEVVVASSAPEAAALAAHEVHAFDLVITDQAMPEMTGTQLARQLRALRPDLPVILYTGFNEGIAPGEVENAGIRAVVTKPVDPHELLGVLQTYLP